jgi:hypothetical protein
VTAFFDVRIGPNSPDRRSLHANQEVQSYAKASTQTEDGR